MAWSARYETIKLIAPVQIWGDYSGVGVYPDDYSERKRQSMKSTCCDQGRGYAGKDVLVERIALGSGAKKKR